LASTIQNMGIDHVVISDSVPFGVPQMTNTQENLCSWLQKSGSAIAMGNVYYRSQIFKRKMTLRIDVPKLSLS